MVSSNIVDGKVTTEELEELIKSKWLKTKEQIYPELTQYLDSWMGFMFWKPDLRFNLKHHLKSHTIVGRNDQEVEENVCSFVQDLLNSPYHPKRSPWEVYVINNYKNELLSKECVNGELSLVVFRFHHSLGDGFSSLKAILVLFDKSFPEICLPSLKQLAITSWWKRLFFCITFPLRMLYDGLNLAYLAIMQSAPLQVPDLNQSKRMLCQRLPLIPIENIKNLKNRLGVTFTAVLLTGLATGLAKAMHHLDAETNQPTTPILTMLPLPGHPNKLRNHFTFAVLEVPTKLELESLQRLKMISSILKAARQNTVPLLITYLSRVIGSLPPVITKLFRRYLVTPVALTNFPGPGMDMEVEGKKLLFSDSVVGTQGVAGVCFTVFSLRNHIRIIAAVEEGVMDQSAAKQMLEYIAEEFDNLNELSVESEVQFKN
ncbi:unnamed protein product [Orchesella dallaii]|uniref:O-acyltransferase WSD1 C-terminal domain-containing protein n=1 Tax=Orchesella dallaii TaxID=48710 RepID=A0ABP1Q0H5_9HEXA